MKLELTRTECSRTAESRWSILMSPHCTGVVVQVEEVVLKRTTARHCPLLTENWREDEQADWKYTYDSDEVKVE